MININIEYLSRKGEWRAYATIGVRRPNLLIWTVSRIMNNMRDASLEWRMRIR